MLYSIKKMIVRYNQMLETFHYNVEESFKNKYLANACCWDGAFIYLDYPGNEMRMFSLIRYFFTDDAPMPSNWKEIATMWVVKSISCDQVEELLHCNWCNIPEEFFKYAAKVEEDYFEYCKDRAEDPYYM